MMNIRHYESYEEMSKTAASAIVHELEAKKDLLLCAATGNSPLGLYAALADGFKKHKSLFKQLKVIKLDEWGGIPLNHPSSCEHYLRTNLLEPMEISEDRYLSFDSNPLDPVAECARVCKELHENGPIDVCILGLGSNGHIGLNEPGLFLEPHCHVARLSEKSLQHSMIQVLNSKPTYGITLGMQDIMNSRKIILLISGDKKEKVTEELLSGKISTALPASLLWLHRNLECLINISASA